MDHAFFLGLSRLTVFILMLAMGVNRSFGDLFWLWRRPGLLFRSLTGAVLLVPLIAVSLIVALRLPPGVAVGLVLLGASPGSPLMTKRAVISGGAIPFNVSLQLSLALLAVISVPMVLGFYRLAFGVDLVSVSMLDVAGQVGTAQFLPLVVGMGLRRVAPGFAGRVGKALDNLSKVLLVVLVVVMALPAVPSLLNLGVSSVAAIVGLAVGALVTGHVLGGPLLEHRSDLALACQTRNIGLALFIAALGDVERDIATTVMAYLAFGIAFSVGYSRWSRR